MSKKKSWKEHLEAYNNRCLEFGNAAVRKACNDEVEALKQKMEERDYQLGDAYYSFLTYANGLNFNGVSFFATEDYLTDRGRTRYGLVEYNDTMREGNPKESDIYIATLGDDILAYTIEGKWVVQDVMSGDVFESFDSFYDLLEHVMDMLQ